MKTNKYKFLYIFLTTIILISCQKDASNLVPLTEKIVVSSYISPADKIQVFLSLSNPYYLPTDPNYNTALKLKNSIVLISDGISQMQLIWNEQEKNFELNQNLFPIIAGKTYSLAVEAEDGRKVSAQTTIPYPVINPVFEFMGNKKNSTNVLSRFQINDDGAILNYYRFYTEIQRPDDPSGNPNFNYVYPPQYRGNYIQSDKDFNGSLFNKVIEFSIENYDNLPIDKFKYSGYFIACSEDYFQFYKTLEISTASGSDPFNEQYVNIYSNIKGGLGIFAGYNLTKLN